MVSDYFPIKPQKERNCIVCKKAFTPASPISMTCSTKCRAIRRYEVALAWRTRIRKLRK